MICCCYSMCAYVWPRPALVWDDDSILVDSMLHVSAIKCCSHCQQSFTAIMLGDASHELGILQVWPTNAMAQLSFLYVCRRERRLDFFQHSTYTAYQLHPHLLRQWPLVCIRTTEGMERFWHLHMSVVSHHLACTRAYYVTCMLQLIVLQFDADSGWISLVGSVWCPISL